MPLPFPGLDRVNCYLLADPRGATLVDCGMFLPDEPDQGWPHLVAALATAGLGPGDITRLIVTHVHIDHYGMAGRLKEENGCEVVFHEGGDADLDILRDPGSVVKELRALFAEHGVAAADLDELTAFEDWRRFVHSVMAADTWLKGDERFTIGEREWMVVHTPGHARGHICLWSPRDALLISGDHLLPTITPHIDLRRAEGDPLGDFLASLARIEELAPRIVLPGHGHPFEDGAERARVNARHHDRRLGAILQVVRRRALTASQITDEIFSGELLNFQKRLALGEALAHIHYLQGRGEIERIEGDDGKVLYRKAQRQ
jgi:glyoxylase-like metal-dependent hydrolase (beta-lactamase superfamily II)